MSGIAAVPLTPHRRALAVVDLDDLPRVLAHKWNMSSRYPATKIGGRMVMLHRFILGEPPGDVCHLNGDRLDCRKANLVAASRSINMLQRHATPARGTVGVRRDRRGWEAYVLHRFAGRFPTKQEALLVRDFLVRCRVGLLATYNFPFPPELSYRRHEYPQPEPDSPAWHPAAVIAARSRPTAAAWTRQKTLLLAASGNCCVSIRCGPGWHADERGEARIEVAGLRVTVFGACLSLPPRAHARWAAMGALGVLSRLAWYMAWRRDNDLMVNHLWGVGGLDLDLVEPTRWPRLLRETAACL